MKPYMIDHVENAGGQTVKKFLPEAYGTLMSSEDASVLSGLMTAVVTDGTGSALRGAPYTAAGKTGSAEFETGKETHAWFVGYAPVEDPKIAVCVLLEESGSGGKQAGPVARAVMDKYFEKNPLQERGRIGETDDTASDDTVFMPHILFYQFCRRSFRRRRTGGPAGLFVYRDAGTQRLCLQ